MADYSKIQEQIEAVKQAQVKAELEMIAASNARLEAARLENERRRKEAQDAYEARVEERRKLKQQAEEKALEMERAEQARLRAEENKQNLALEQKQREEEEARVLQEKLNELQHNHERALKALQDSLMMQLTHEQEQDVTSDTNKVLDGTAPKVVITDGSKNPLFRFVQDDNK
jgi:hypothetical protein